MSAQTTAAAKVTVVTSLVTLDSDSATFEIGTFTITLTIPTSTNPSYSGTNGGIVTETSSPPSRLTTAMSTSATAPSATSSASLDISTGPSAGQLAGIIVGSVAGGCLLTALIFLCFCWGRKRQQIIKQKAFFAGKDAGAELSQGPAKEDTLGMAVREQMSERRASDRRSFWRRSIDAVQRPVATDLTERQRFARRLSSTRPNTRAYLQISPPIPVTRPSIQDGFEDGFFRQPGRKRQAEDDYARHGSDATTIRTSGNPPTPVRPAITLLRLCSSSTSKSKSNSVDGEDKHDEDDEVPPLPTFANFGMPNNSRATRPSQDEALRKELESGIRANLSKATSRIPLTPGWDSVNSSVWGKAQAPSRSWSSLTKSRKEKTVQWEDPRSSSSAAARSAASLKASRTKFPVLSSQPVPILEIPERSSSRQGMRQDLDSRTGQQWTPSDDRTSVAAYWNRSHEEELLVSPVTLTFSPSSSRATNLTIPRKPVPASGHQLGALDLTTNSPVSPEEDYQRLPPENIFKYSRKPLPPIIRAGLETRRTSSHTTDTCRVEPPRRAPAPPTDRRASQGQPIDNYNSPRATLTPNRTPTGDLVLTVDMLDYIVYD